jgi:hypothetical protein
MVEEKELEKPRQRRVKGNKEMRIRVYTFGGAQMW